METKLCKQCGQIKDISCFSQNDVVRNGVLYHNYRPQCKECTGKSQREKAVEKRAKRPASKACARCSKDTPIEKFISRKGIANCMSLCPSCCEEEHQLQFNTRREALANITEKACSYCKVVKKLSEFHKDINKPDGHKETCKDCYKIRRDSKAIEIRKNIVVPDFKVCSKCKEPKPANYFKSDITKPDGLYYLCRSCDKIRNDNRIARHQANRVIPDKKVCSTCNVEKFANEFWEDTRSTDGLSYACKICANKKAIEYREDQGDEYRRRANERAKEHYKKNADKIKEYQKEYNEKNKDKISARQLVYDKNRYHTDARYRLTQILRKRLRIALVYKAVTKKSKRTFELLGMPLDEFKYYFESKFTKGMSWDSFLNGEIHIDHIRPCSSFDLAKAEDQAKCFHYTNLQPLWAEDNMAKHDKLDWHNEEINA